MSENKIGVALVYVIFGIMKVKVICLSQNE